MISIIERFTIVYVCKEKHLIKFPLFLLLLLLLLIIIIIIIIIIIMETLLNFLCTYN